MFRENIGNSLDVTNGFAFLDQRESEFKSRSVNSFTPNHTHANDPDGPWNDPGPYRFRNQQRTIGYFNFIGDDPSLIPYSWTVFTEANPPVYYADWSFDGWGTSTMRLERDFESDNFPHTNPTQGQSDFFDQVDISIQGDVTQWDTGRNLPGFIGDTEWSLNRGDIFNVAAGLDPILADSLDENDNFAGATDLGTISGNGNSVNALATNGVLSVETKGDRDYYKFVAGGTGTVTVNLQVTDMDGDQLVYMLYEFDEDFDSAYVGEGTLDIGLWTRDAIAEVLPAMILCQETCAGLCATCGVDRNTVACDCAQAPTDSRWDALRALSERLESPLQDPG